MAVYYPTIQQNTLLGSNVVVQSSVPLMSFIRESSINKYIIDAIDIQSQSFVQLQEKITYTKPNPSGLVMSESKNPVLDIYQKQSGLKNISINKWVIDGVSYIEYVLHANEFVTMIFKMNRSFGKTPEEIFKEKTGARSAFDLVQDISSTYEYSEPCNNEEPLITQMAEAFGSGAIIEGGRTKFAEKPLPEPKKMPYNRQSPYVQKNNKTQLNQTWSVGASDRDVEQKIPWSSIRRNMPDRLIETIEFDDRTIEKEPYNKKSPFINKNQITENMEEQFHNFTEQEVVDGGKHNSSTKNNRVLIQRGLMIAGVIFIGLIAWGLLTKKKHVQI